MMRSEGFAGELLTAEVALYCVADSGIPKLCVRRECSSGGLDSMVQIR